MGMQYMYFNSPPYLPRTSYPTLNSPSLTSPYQSMQHSTFPPTMPLQQTSLSSAGPSPPNNSSVSNPSSASHSVINMDNNNNPDHSSHSNFMFKYNPPMQSKFLFKIYIYKIYKENLK